MRNHAWLSCAVMARLLLGTAGATENPRDCAQAYEKAQEEKTAARLTSALVHLKTCIAVECPAFIREDCVRWLAQTESALPTFVFSVEQDGSDLTEVEIRCDNMPLTRKLDGKAIAVDPGPHEFSLRLPGHVPVERKILAREGERNRNIKVEFNSSTRLPPLVEPAPTGAESSRGAEANSRLGNLGPYALAGLGVLGLAGFTTFAILGNSQQGDLERTCSPNCQASQVDSVKSKYLLADVSLGVGLVSLGVATYWWISRRGKEDSEQRTATSIDLVPRAVGGVLRVSTTY